MRSFRKAAGKQDWRCARWQGGAAEHVRRGRDALLNRAACRGYRRWQHTQMTPTPTWLLTSRSRGMRSKERNLWRFPDFWPERLNRCWWHRLQVKNTRAVWGGGFSLDGLSRDLHGIPGGDVPGKLVRAQTDWRAPQKDWPACVSWQSCRVTKSTAFLLYKRMPQTSILQAQRKRSEEVKNWKHRRLMESLIKQCLSEKED